MSAAASQSLRERARALIETNARAALRAPPFDTDLAWWNVERPLTLEQDLRGRVVLLVFWTSGCVHCQHVLAEAAWLEQRFAAAAFAVVSVHGAARNDELAALRLRHTLLREGIQHAVIDDERHALRSRLGVRAWPTLVLLSPDGLILGQVAGEGQRAVLAALIEAALELYGERGALQAREFPSRPEIESEFELPLRYPTKLLADESSSRLWIADSGHHRVVECDLTGKFLRAFGCGERGLVDGPAHSARFAGPEGLALDGGALLVADTRNHALRSIDLASGVVSTLVGNGEIGYERAGEFAATSARLNSPRDVLALDDVVLIAMAGSQQLWAFDRSAGRLRPVAGDGAAALRDGAAASARLAQPSALARAGRSVLCVDLENAALREYDVEHATLTTLASGAAQSMGSTASRAPLVAPSALVAERPDEHGAFCAYIADAGAHRVWLFASASGVVSSYVGDGEAGANDGACDAAQLDSPEGVTLAGDALLVSDSLNHAVREVDLVEHQVRTLDLSSVPLPRAPRSNPSLAALELPRSGGTIDHGPRKLRLPATGAALELELELRAGESLAPGAPAQYRVRRIDGLAAARSVAGALTPPLTRIELGAAGDGSLELSALFYVVDEAGACRLRSHVWRFDIQFDERAPARAIRLSASLTP